MLSPILTYKKGELFQFPLFICKIMNIFLYITITEVDKKERLLDSLSFLCICTHNLIVR